MSSRHYLSGSNGQLPEEHSFVSPQISVDRAEQCQEDLGLLHGGEIYQLAEAGKAR